MKPADRSFAVILAVLTVAAAMSIAVRQGAAVNLQKSFAEFPRDIGEWKGSAQAEFPKGVLAVLQLSDYIHRNYTRNGETVNFYVGFYQQQRAGESMHSPKNCLPGSGWEVLESRRVPLSIPKVGKTIEVNYYVVQNESQKQFVLYFYDTHGRAFASEYEGKAILVWEALRTGRTDGALIRVMLPFTGTQEGAERLATAFVQEAYPVLREYLPPE